MSAKILISALSNSGKTTLLKDLENVLVIAVDGKKYPFPQPHVNISGFDSVAELLDIISDKVEAYLAKYKVLPSVVAIDSVSRIFEIIANNCNKKHTGFTIYTELNKEIALFTNYIENTLIGNNISTVIISHAIWDADTARYVLVAQGSFQKAGGFLSIVDNAVFLEVKNGKRIVHHRTPKFAARTVLTELPDSLPVDEYNLQDHINLLLKTKDEVAEWSI